MRELQAIHADRDQVREAIANAGQGTDVSQWKVEEMRYTTELAEATTFWANQQNLEDRIEQAKETGYIFDNLETSSGVKLPELSYSPENNELQAIAVQRFALAQEDAFNAKLNAMEYELTQERILTNDLNEHIDQLEREKKQVEFENKELQNNVRNAADIIAEHEIEIKQQAKRISELLEQQAGSAVPIAPLSAEERETKLLAELNGNRTKVTNIRLKDTDGFDTRISLANNALTGEEIEFHTIYIKRYEEISEEAAEQLRADYANKKAELDQLATIIPIQSLKEPDILPVTNIVMETDEAAEIQPFPEKEVPATELGLADQSLSFSGEETDDHTSEIAEDELNRATPANMSHIKALSDQIEFLKGSLQTTIARVDYMVGQAVA